MTFKMNISRFVVGALVLCALPVLAQPELKPVNGLPYPVVTPEEAVKLGQSDTPIALHLRDVTVRQALDELQKQGGVTLDTRWGDQNALSKRLSLDLQTHSLQEAFKSILDEADIKGMLQRSNKSGSYQAILGQFQMLTELPQGTPVSGLPSFPVRVLNLNSTSSKTLTPGKSPVRNQESQLSVALGYSADPLLPLAGQAIWRVTRADDEQGRSLKSDDNSPFNHMSSSSRMYAMYGGVSGQGQVFLRAPQPDSHKLAHLEGKAVFVLSTKSQHFEVSDLLGAKDVSHTFQNATQSISMLIHGARQTGNTILLDVDVTPNAMMAFDGMNSSPFSANELLSALRVRDAKGQELTFSGSNASGRNNMLSAHQQFTLEANPLHREAVAGGKPAPPPETPVLTGPISLVMDVPTEFVQAEVPFSFSDLPLP
jgi:hypothetical protein